MSTRSITPNDPANFTPTLGNYKDLQPFRYWCQKVLPLVYDDSLSYYELLCKVVDYLNKTIEDVGVLEVDVTSLREAYVKLQDYVNKYFDSLDVQEEINNKLDALITDGTITDIFTKIFYSKSSPVFVNSVSDMTDSKSIYVLISSGNIYQYSNGSFVDTGLKYSQANSYIWNGMINGTELRLSDYTNVGTYGINATTLASITDLPKDAPSNLSSSLAFLKNEKGFGSLYFKQTLNFTINNCWENIAGFERLLKVSDNSVYKDWSKINSQMLIGRGTTNTLDIDVTGLYYLGRNVQNAPIKSNDGYLLIVLNQSDITYNTDEISKKQILIPINQDYNQGVYFRNFYGTNAPWFVLGENTLTYEEVTVDFNELVNNHRYVLSSTAGSISTLNSPTGKAQGTLLNTSYNKYYNTQIFCPYNSNNIYARQSYRSSNNYLGFHEWVEIANKTWVNNSISALISKTNYITKINDTSFYCYVVKGEKLLRYKIMRETNDNIHQDILRVSGCVICNSDESESKVLIDSGADLEGVVNLPNGNNIGGVHGSEILEEYCMYIDGVKYTLDSITSGLKFNKIEYIVKSNVYLKDGTTLAFTKTKHMIIDNNGFKCTMNWNPAIAIDIEYVYACMMSVQTYDGTVYYDSHVNTYPVNVPNTGTNLTINSDVTDMYWDGYIPVHAYFDDMDDIGRATLVLNYKDSNRTKTYFSCYHNTKTVIGTRIHAVNIVDIG